MRFGRLVSVPATMITIMFMLCCFAMSGCAGVEVRGQYNAAGGVTR